MTEPAKAVFLSYASQNAAAAHRLADDLRAGGVEVWLDTTELRGGDAWDQKIKKRIRDCALFANSQDGVGVTLTTPPAHSSDELADLANILARLK